jgi:hypothetical protein
MAEFSESKELCAALSRAQAKIEGAKKDSNNPHFKNAYADLASVWDAIREPLTSEGLSVIQLVTDTVEGAVGLTTVLMHSSGQSVQSTFSMPVSQKGNPQAVGSAITYARRYALMAIAGVAPEDDDGNAAAPAYKPKAATVSTPAPTSARSQVQWAQAWNKCGNFTERKALFGELSRSETGQIAKSGLMTEWSQALKKESDKLRNKEEK